MERRDSSMLKVLLLGAQAQFGWRLLLLALTIAVSYLALSPVPPKTPLETGWDKANHLLAFGALAFSGHWGWARRFDRYVRLPAGLMIFGAAIELLQLQVPGRDGEWADLFADGCGVLIGLLLAWLTCYFIGASKTIAE